MFQGYTKPSMPNMAEHPHFKVNEHPKTSQNYSTASSSFPLAGEYYYPQSSSGEITPYNGELSSSPEPSFNELALYNGEISSAPGSSPQDMAAYNPPHFRPSHARLNIARPMSPRTAGRARRVGLVVNDNFMGEVGD